MSRKNINITMQLNRNIDNLLRIGEKKIKDDRTNPNRADGIHSIKTADTYRQTARALGEYLKSILNYTILFPEKQLKSVNFHILMV